MLTYKIVYSPNLDTHTNILKTVDFTCSDGKLHLRLRDYDHEEVICGFINKLTYLVTYLFQRSANKNDLTTKTIEEVVKNDESFVALNSWLKSNFANIGKKYKGLKITKNYRKISECNPSGSFVEGTCPLKNNTTYGDLDFFHQSLRGFGIENFLFNDAVELVISKVKVKDSYKKFHNKAKKSKKETLEYIPLF